MKNNFINNIRKNYSNGIMIKQEVWDKLAKIYSVLGSVQEQQDYLKLNATVDNFTECTIEEYELLVRVNNIMYTTLINLQDCLAYSTDGNVSVLKNDKEASKLVESCLNTIVQLRDDLEEYYNEEL